jgi:hypothetical protein
MKHIYILPLILLTACNSMYIKPNTLDKTSVIYAQRGGYTMRRSIKERMEQRDYNLRVGKSQSTQSINGGSVYEGLDMNTDIVPSDAKYVVRVDERIENFAPFWCFFNGFWWWRFNVSIAIQETGEEIFTWRGNGCANSSLRKLDAALDKLEIK